MAHFSFLNIIIKKVLANKIILNNLKNQIHILNTIKPLYIQVQIILYFVHHV